MLPTQHRQNIVDTLVGTNVGTLVDTTVDALVHTTVHILVHTIVHTYVHIPQCFKVFQGVLHDFNNAKRKQKSTDFKRINVKIGAFGGVREI